MFSEGLCWQNTAPEDYFNLLSFNLSFCVQLWAKTSIDNYVVVPQEKNRLRERRARDARQNMNFVPK